MKTIKRLFLFLLLVVALFAAFLIYQGRSIYLEAIEQEPLQARIDRVKAQPNYTPIEALPAIYLDAVVAVEDQRFYSHSGIDIASTVRAAVNNLKAKDLVEGGSSITQQLAKNLYFSQEKLLTRKIAELFMAFDLESSCSKDEILELYVNSIYFGSGYYCVYDAAMGYFGCEPADMTDYQSTLLAGIPNAPSVYSLDANPDLARQRQEYVLSCMVSSGYITQQRSAEISAEGEAG